MKQEDCDARHATLDATIAAEFGKLKDCIKGKTVVGKWLFGIVFTLLVGFIAVAGWSMHAGTASKDASHKVDQKLNVHEAGHKAIGVKIEHIESDVDEIKTNMAEQTRMIRELHRKAGGS